MIIFEGFYICNSFFLVFKTNVYSMTIFSHLLLYQISFISQLLAYILSTSPPFWTKTRYLWVLLQIYFSVFFQSYFSKLFLQVSGDLVFFSFFGRSVLVWMRQLRYYRFGQTLFPSFITFFFSETIFEESVSFYWTFSSYTPQR